jgi:hypothetical protein
MDNFQTKAQVVCVAHYHPYQGIVKNCHGTTFIAPGALARRKKVAHDTNRDIKCVYIVVTDDLQFTTKEINVPYEKDVWTEKTVLDISDDSCYADLSAEVVKMKNLLIEKMEFSSIEEMIKIYATATKTDENVLNFTLGELAKL